MNIHEDLKDKTIKELKPGQIIKRKSENEFLMVTNLVEEDGILNLINLRNGEMFMDNEEELLEYLNQVISNYSLVKNFDIVIKEYI